MSNPKLWENLNKLTLTYSRMHLVDYKVNMYFEDYIEEQYIVSLPLILLQMKPLAVSQ